MIELDPLIWTTLGFGILLVALIFFFLLKK